MIFAQEFNLRPADVDGLTAAEFDAFAHAADRLIAEAKKGARGA